MRDFDGKTYEPDKDRSRLSRQLDLVRDLMADGEWRSLAEIAQATGEHEASVSARLRDLRKPRFGAYVVDRRRVEGGLFAYRVTERPGADPVERVSLDPRDYPASRSREQMVGRFDVSLGMAVVEPLRAGSQRPASRWECVLCGNQMIDAEPGLPTLDPTVRLAQCTCRRKPVPFRSLTR